MKQSSGPQPINEELVEAVVNQFFPTRDARVERVLSGVSTYVYRVISPHGQVCYLRILPEIEASLAPEIMVLMRLCQQHLRVPEVLYFEEYNPILGRPVMLEAEVKGLALSKSSLSLAEFEGIVVEAGRDLARINSLPVKGFGWIQPADTNLQAPLRAKWSTHRAFALETRAADLAYLRTHLLDAAEMAQLERVLTRYDEWLDEERATLAHGDFDTTHIFQDQGTYTGIIDFGEVRGTAPWYDLAHFRIRDGALPVYRLFSALERGYAEIMPFPPSYEQHLRFTSIQINLRALTRAFQTRAPDEYIWRQMAMLQEDLDTLC